MVLLFYTTQEVYTKLGIVSKLLTDITEFALPNGKLYLSAMIDCFDGMVIGWTIGSRPNADLVNTMLDGVIAELPDGCYPTVHSDRGCHYRWPGRIQRMREAGLTRFMSKRDVLLIMQPVKASLAD